MWALVNDSNNVTNVYGEFPSRITINNRNYDKAELNAMSDSEKLAIKILNEEQYKIDRQMLLYGNCIYYKGRLLDYGNKEDKILIDKFYKEQNSKLEINFIDLNLFFFK